MVENDDKFEFMDVSKIGSFVARYPGALGNTLEVALREIGAMSDDELAAGLTEFVLCTGLVAPAMPAKLCDIVQSIHVEAVPQ